MTTTVDKEAIYQTLKWCTAAYLQHGHRKVQLPKDTDPTKTYQWRYMEALTRKFQEWDFGETQRKSFIEIAVQYAARNKLTNKGLSIFMQSNLLDICLEETRKRDGGKRDIVGVITRTHAWLMVELENYRQKSKSRADKSLVDMLLHSETMGGYSNLVRWFQDGHLPEQYLVLSRACGICIGRLAGSVDRSLLPKDSKLFMLRMALLNDNAIKFSVRNILNDDWRKPL